MKNYPWIGCLGILYLLAACTTGAVQVVDVASDPVTQITQKGRADLEEFLEANGYEGWMVGVGAPPAGTAYPSMSAGSGSECYCGDIDSDGRISIGDIVTLANYLFGDDVSASVECADVDGNAGVTIDDLDFVLAYIFQGGPPPCLIGDPPVTPTPTPTPPPEGRNISCTNFAVSHPDWVFCDDFEDGTWRSNPNWDESPGHGPEGPEAVRCDGNSFGFLDRCSAYSGIGYFDTYWGYDNHFGNMFFPQEYEELYLRTYIYFSDPYVWGDTSDKGIYFQSFDSNGEPLISNIKMEYSSYGDPDGIYMNIGKANISSYSLSKERRFQNKGNDLVWSVGKWYLVEFHVKLNTPGQANGVAEFWIDEVADPQPRTLRLEYTNIMIRNAGQTHGYNTISLTNYHQRCDLAVCPETVNQWVKWDNLVVSTNLVGP